MVMLPSPSTAVSDPAGPRAYLLGALGLLLLLLLFLFPVKSWFVQEGLRWLYILLFSFLLSFLAVIPIRAYARKQGIVDWPDARKLHGEPTPLLGGYAIYLAFLISLLANSILTPALWGLLVAGTLVIVVSRVDDVRPLPAAFKLGVLLLATAIVIASGISVALFPTWSLWGQVLNALLTVLWIVGITNAMNFFDGMDGLAGGLAAIAAFFLGIIAYQSQQTFLGWISAALLGSTLGFVPYNFRPGNRATIFLGDAGANFLGFVLASLAVMGDWAEDNVVKVSAPLLIFGVFVYDMVYITVDRVVSGKVRSVREWIEYVGRDHFHHRLEQVLGKREYAVVFIYAVSVALSVGAVVVLMAPPLAAVLLICQALSVFVILTILERKGRVRT
jgi:UDP-GlcNAc:undecaprenyl-phosphate GlcNAc-1-phosphate transferase